MSGLVLAIHVLLDHASVKTWMPGARPAAKKDFQRGHHGPQYLDPYRAHLPERGLYL